MAVLIPNIAKGKVARYAELPLANDALIWVLLKSAGLVSDAVLRDLDTLSDILAGASDEATFTGYARVIHSSGITVTVDDTNDRMDVDDTVDPTWSPTSAEALGKILCCYDADTTAGTDADLIPLFADDYVLTTPTSGTTSYTVATGGFYRAS